MDGPIEKDAFADMQGDAARHERGIERNHRVVVPLVDLGDGRFQPDRRPLQRVPQRNSLGTCGLQIGDIGQIRAQIAVRWWYLGLDLGYAISSTVGAGDWSGLNAGNAVDARLRGPLARLYTGITL